MKRNDVLAHLRYAGYHNNSQAFGRLFSEHRISYAAARKEWDLGQVLRVNGMTCGCYTCQHPSDMEPHE